jgi:predicted alpha/beta hydrolase
MTINKNNNIDDIEIINVSVNTADNFKLSVSQFIPSNEMKGVILIASATAVKRQHYYHFSKFLSQHGYVVLCFDYRGIGGSLHDNLKSLQANIRDWGEQDLNAMINWAKSTYNDHPLHFIGHSIGGQLLALSKDNNKLTSVLHCSVQSGYWKLWQGFERYKLFFLWHILVPTLTKTLRYFPSKRLGVGEDLPSGIIYEWARWCRDPEYMFGKYAPESIVYLKQISLPVRSYSFEGDNLAPKACVDFIANHYNCNVERIHINPKDFNLKKIGHFDIFRPKMESTLWAEFLTWINNNN